MKNLSEKNKFYPLTESQRGVYFECMENPESTKYNIPLALELPENVDCDKFEQAVVKTASLHPAFFVNVCMKNGEPVMVAGDKECVVVRKNGDIEEEKKEFVKPFNLKDDSLFRFEICIDKNRKVFLFDVHHIVFDGTSMKLFLTQLIDCYNGKEILPESRSIFDYAGQEDGLKESSEYKEAQAFFDQMLDGRELNEGLISDVREKEYGYGSVTVASPDELSQEVMNHFARSNKMTAATIFAAAFGVALSIYTGSDEAYYTTASSGRHHTNLPDAVGMFVKMLPICVDIPEEESVIQFLHHFEELFHGAVKNECISFGDCAAKYGTHSKVSFVYQSNLFSSFVIDGQPTSLEYISQASPSDVLFMVMKKGDRYESFVQYNKELYTQAYIQSFAESVFEIAKGMICTEKLSELNLLPEKQKSFMDSFNDTDQPYDTTQTVSSVFENIIRKYPQKTALVFKDHSYTYEMVDGITKNIAGYIQSLGLSKENFVAVLAPRNDDAVLSAWGIIRSGAAFQMLDSTYPPERLNYMISDSKAKLLIVDRNLMHLIEDYEGVVLYTDELTQLPMCTELHSDIRPEDALTMIYTSGTTGKPKGSVLENRNLVAFFHKHAMVMEIDETSHIATYASFGFDAGIMDIVSTAMSGACLYIVPDEIRLDMMDVEKFYITNEITQGFMTTQVGRMFAEITKCQSLKAFMVGGEKLVPFKVQDHFRFLNGYGPCETMAYVCHYEVHDNYLLQPIGKPGINTKLYVADKFGRLLPIGAVGELCITGRQVGRGYLGLPEKTAEVFVKNPYDNVPGYERMYKSGDIVRLLPEGNIDYVGRRDGQVKVRGFRVELTEIEEIIRRFEGVKDATVTAFDEPSGGKYIAAYVTGDAEINIEALHKFIGAEKPAYMVPKVTMQIEAIPYNQNQKVSRRALPVPEIRHAKAEITKPETELQRAIFALVSRVLGTNQFGIDSNLFECGLTSIGLLRLNTMLSEELNANISIADIRKNNTIRAMADICQGEEEEQALPVLKEYTLMKNQLGVYLDCLRNEGSLVYNIPVLFKLSSDIDTEKLQACLQKAIDIHSYIKATLKVDDDGNPKLVRNDEDKAVVSLIKGELPSMKNLVKSFDLIGGSLYRAEIYETKTDKYLFLDVHHILSDGSSLAVLLNDVNLAYGDQAIKDEPFTCFDAALQEEKISAEKTDACEAYFEQLLKDCNVESLPEFCPEETMEQSGEMSFTVTENATAISEYCEKNKITANAFFNAAFGYTLASHLHTNDVNYCTVYNGRSSAKLERCFGMLVKTLPVRCEIGKFDSVHTLASKIQTQILDTMANDTLSFMDLSVKYKVKPDIFFNYQGDNFIFDQIGGQKAEMQDISILPAKAPMTLEVFLQDGTYRLKVTYRKDCYNKEFIEGFVQEITENVLKFAGGEKLQPIEILKKDQKQSSGEKSVSKSYSGKGDKELEKRICDIFASVLGIEEVNSSDSFFEIGGTSLTASKVTMSLMSEGIEVKYGDIFDNPSPEKLAFFIAQRDGKEEGSQQTEEQSNTRDALQWNTTKYAKDVKREPLGNVLLTGAVGFLGVHLLKELLEIEEGHIYCLVRKGSFDSSEIRLRTMLFYYFSNDFEEALRDRITCIDADITDAGLADVLADVPFDTVINSAACVKHFADGDIIERINVGGVENLIDICKKRDKKLIQISTVSIPGIHTKESYEKHVKMHENELFVIDDMDNKYGISKYHAELKMFEAIEGGMRGKVLRAGNLMGRHSDGEFQANMESNMFLSGIRGFATMGKYPISHMVDPMRFSPVDCTAKAMVLLAGTNDMFTAFNCDNRYGFDEMKVIDACNRNGLTIVPEEDEKYYEEFREKLGNEKLNSKLNGLAAYDIQDAHSVDTDNLFTTNILYRIGFSWPLVDDAYLDRAINSILTLDYFDLDSDIED